VLVDFPLQVNDDDDDDDNNNNNNNNVSLLQLQTNAAKDTHNICHVRQYIHTVQHGNVSSHTWTTAMDYSHTGGARFTQCR